MKINKYIKSLFLASLAVGMTTSCQDMMDKGNDYVIYTGDELVNPSDTTTSVLGIINKLQAISVRTNLLGEVRADLVKVNDNANIDLKKLANFEADVNGDDDENLYNSPRDYYAVINNCNYYLKYASAEAGNINRNEKYFEYEIAQVHSIRAWTYLQLVTTYGRVPYVTEPVTTKQDAEAQYPVYDIAQMCDALIEDLTPFVGVRYPDPGNVGIGGFDPRLMFFPSQIVMGDLYLWKAAATQSKAAAKLAAKSYYDYIVWKGAFNEKQVLTTGTSRAYWSEQMLSREMYMTPSGSTISFGGTWGRSQQITVIPMDSGSAEGYYNELRLLYNTNVSTDLTVASISPSQAYRELSEAQEYFDYDDQKDTVKVDPGKIDESVSQDGYRGDLRFQNNFRTRDYSYNNEEVKYQTIFKHNYQHVSIYRAHQIYLRLAEALNYAGYPRFARAILTMGLSNTVIEGEVLPYYTSKEDSTYIQQFDFNDQDFVAYFESYKAQTDQYGTIISIDGVTRSNVNQCTQLGIHSRGCGLAFLDTTYCAYAKPDMTAFPFAKRDQVGNKPVKDDYEWPEEITKPNVVEQPVGWEEFNHEKMSEEQYKEFTGKKFGYATYSTNFDNYVTYIEELKQYDSDYAQYKIDSTAVAEVMNADILAYNDRLTVYKDAYKTWYDQAYYQLIPQEQDDINEAILTEQALEMAYEGNRYYDLMRRALWYNDPSRLANPIGKRNPSLTGKLMDKRNWFLHYKGKIGY